MNGELLKIWIAELAGSLGPNATPAVPGTCTLDASGSVIVACGDGCGLRLREVQPASGRRMPATEYAKRWTSRASLRLGT